VDNTASLVQPLIHPLFRNWTAHEILHLLTNEAGVSSYDLVRETWKSHADGNFEDWWKRALNDGFITETAADSPSLSEPKLPDLPALRPADELTLVLQPDPTIWDGSFANNAWLQECPKPLTKQVWGNALCLNEAEAHRRGLTTGDVVSLSGNGRSVRATVLVEPGVADGVATLSLGFGRKKAGEIGKDIGIDAYPLRTTDAMWLVPDISLSKTGTRQDVLVTQNIVRSIEDVHSLYPLINLTDLNRLPPKEEADQNASLLPAHAPSSADHSWAMTIDASSCIGCNACVVACQAENNVPVVGPEEVARGRDMHWLRVDVYDHGQGNAPRLGFQPVPCMQCEHAPCEPVCPVAASVHDSEGLNLQVYNRCIGTRFCEANCPYKVRRFNFYGYADGQEYANLGLESYRAQKNPEVTVRSRGVMEKCTYCVQRISAARRAAEREDRPMQTDEVRTACQSACPTQAITFGDLRDADAAINTKRKSARHYVLLEHLGTRPRTTYLADIRNPSSATPEEAI